ncbi:hypothetical protein AArcSl_0230 [Halalkaliarchaeum desulfuricum]|uniref:Uncharacterized protein n=1 Tax=Halalkaliarchaeum desulfuricum TaxID=2055893 RepID=A0A343TFL3_9EURY|nr:zinc ribbon domain-containing protein [Halalkaliarchaeum desulfuricum]AUX07885.1 hypothetical protein AArcSl_0230 [Halalkaliarchaeum desulfuricum]
MSDLSSLALGFRLLTAAVAVFGPTVLFLCLLRFLEWLRDDALVTRLTARGMDPEPEPAPVDFLSPLGAESSSAPGSGEKTRETNETDDFPG